LEQKRCLLNKVGNYLREYFLEISSFSDTLTDALKKHMFENIYKA